MMGKWIQPVVLFHGEASDLDIESLEFNSKHILQRAVEAIRSLSGVDMKVAAPHVYWEDTEPAGSLKEEWRRLRDRGSEEYASGAIPVYFSYDVGFNVQKFGGWGGVDGEGNRLAVLRKTSLEVMQLVMDGKIKYEKILPFIWLAAHEILHALGLPHLERNPRERPCAEQNIMCYSSPFFVQWANRLRPSYGLVSSQLEHLKNLSFVDHDDRLMSTGDSFHKLTLGYTEGLYMSSKLQLIPVGVPNYPKPQPKTRARRTNGAADIHQIQIHATRGNTDVTRQVQATVNWFSNPSNVAGRSWGASADFVVGRESRFPDNPVVAVQFGNWMETWSHYSAGYGSTVSGTLPAAAYGVAIEVAQRRENEPFDPEVVEMVAELCKHINETLEKNGHNPVPLIRVFDWDQASAAPVPRGYIGHDEMANGKRLGKTDPGSMWDWDKFFDLISGETAIEVDKIVEILDALNQSISQQKSLIESISETKDDLMNDKSDAENVLDSLVRQKVLLENI